jgi:hypothetical protein
MDESDWQQRHVDLVERWIGDGRACAGALTIQIGGHGGLVTIDPKRSQRHAARRRLEPGESQDAIVGKVLTSTQTREDLSFLRGQT